MSKKIKLVFVVQELDVVRYWFNIKELWHSYEIACDEAELEDEDPSPVCMHPMTGCNAGGGKTICCAHNIGSEKAVCGVANADGVSNSMGVMNCMVRSAPGRSAVRMEVEVCNCRAIDNGINGERRAATRTRGGGVYSQGKHTGRHNKQMNGKKMFQRGHGKSLMQTNQTLWRETAPRHHDDEMIESLKVQLTKGIVSEVRTGPITFVGTLEDCESAKKKMKEMTLEHGRHLIQKTVLKAKNVATVITKQGEQKYEEVLKIVPVEEYKIVEKIVEMPRFIDWILVHKVLLITYIREILDI